MSAYKHSFPPSATLAYAIRMVEGGWDPRAAIAQAAIEHGHEQAEEAAAQVKNQLRAGHTKDMGVWLRAAKRAMAQIKSIEARQ